MLLPTPPLPDTTPITFLTLLLGLGASCCGAWRLAQSSPQLEQSWVHSSLILLFPAPKGGAASCIIQMIHAQGASPRSLPFYHTTKAAPLQGGAEQSRRTRRHGGIRCIFQNGIRVAAPCFCCGRRRALAKDRPLPLWLPLPKFASHTQCACKFGRLPQLQLGCFCRRQRLAFVVLRLFRQNGSHPNKKSHRLNPPEETLPSELSIREAPV